MNRKIIALVAFLAIVLSFTSYAQKFRLPAIPKYDSVYVDSYNGTVLEKSYFLDKHKVFEIGYNTGSMFYTPFAHIGGGEEDSCYAYFNGPNHDQYDFYYISETYIINEKYSETSKLFRYSKFDWDNRPIENGDSWFIKAMYESTISHSSKYRIGKWIKYDQDGKPVETIDYDKGTINGKPLRLKGEMEIIDGLKALADRRIIDVYGKKFFSKYVRFNFSRSGYYPYKDPRPEQPGGYSLLKAKEGKDPIEFADLSYDIVLDDERFNVIQFRISKDGKFLGRTHYPDFMTKYFNLTQGLDSANRGKFHSNVLNWEEVATQKGLDVTSRAFNVRFEFKPASDYYGDLRLVVEQVVESISTRNSFTNKLKQFKIDPWTGEVVEAEDEEGTVSIMMDVEN
jgi:hypothetical protein